MSEKTKPEIEVFKINLNARGLVSAREIFRERNKELFKSEDFKSLDLGFELPAKFLQIGGQQPTLAMLTVLANKLKMQVVITHIELVPLEKIEAENAETAKTGE